MSRILSLDVGDVRIGIAISDPMQIIAQGYSVYERVGIKKDTQAILDIVNKEDCNIIVIGLPFSFEGKASMQTEKTREFAKRLQNKLTSNGLQDVKIVFEDERFTTKIAEAVLIEADVKRQQRASVIDKQAAVIILQGYLEKNRDRGEG
jgi:putative Holliday junction resolvase